MLPSGPKTKNERDEEVSSKTRWQLTRKPVVGYRLTWSSMPGPTARVANGHKMKMERRERERDEKRETEGTATISSELYRVMI